MLNGKKVKLRMKAFNIFVLFFMMIAIYSTSKIFAESQTKAQYKTGESYLETNLEENEEEDIKDSNFVTPLYSTIPPTLPSGVNFINPNDIFGSPRGWASINSNNSVTITPGAARVDGNIWSKKRIDLKKPSHIEAYIYLGNSGSRAGEGMTFTLQGEGSDYFGFGGAGLGVYTGSLLTKTLNIEFDQWYNTVSDYDKNVNPKKGHVAFISGDKVFDHKELYPLEQSWSDGQWRKLTIDTVYTGGTYISLTYKVQEGLNTLIEKTVRCNYEVLGTSQPYWGFSGGTGNDDDLFALQAICIKEAPQTPKIETKDIDYYVGETWFPGEGLITVTDEAGKPVSWGDKRLSADSNEETFTKPGNKLITYSYKNTYDNVNFETSQKVNITIKEDKSSIVTKDSIIKQGETWQPSDNFVSATDAEGNDILLNSVLISTNDASVDTSKPGKYELKYTNKGAPSGPKDSNFTVEVIEEKLVVGTQSSDVFLGTSINDIHLDDFITKVEMGDKQLENWEYNAELVGNIDTFLIGTKPLKIKVYLKDNPGKSVEVSTEANIVWGSTLVIKDNGLGRVDASVSLLHKDGSPYLNANQGSGFSGTTLTSRSEISVYQNSEAEKVLTAHYETVGNTPSVLAGKWNTIFQDNAVKYGNVLRIHVNKWNGGANWKGNNTFISRNNTLITETVGYDYAYYELTTSGYRLLRLNQLVVNNNQKVKLNTSKEEMNKNISDYISLPEHIENPNNYRMEFESVETASSGNKKSTINVYETLESGGEFKTTYEVAYTVYPEITESYYDVDGKQIEQSQTTEFEYGKEFAPSPEKYIENNGVLYVYKGWVDALPGTGAIIPQEGIPAPTLVEKNYYYIYEKADKFINVTLPTEVVFGTFENNNKISSKKYEIKNNSKELPIEVSLERFDKVKSDIMLLSSDVPDPTQEEASAKLNLCVDNDRIIPGLTEATPTQSITKIDTNASRVISLEGTYFGNMSEKNILDYKMHLKFKAIQDNKN